MTNSFIDSIPSLMLESSLDWEFYLEDLLSFSPVFTIPWRLTLRQGKCGPVLTMMAWG